jgi:hypothetical protein
MICGCPPSAPLQSVDHQPFSLYCTTCTVAVLDVNFTSDYTGIAVVFAVNITFPTFTGIPTTTYSQALCDFVLNPNTTATLGTVY